MVYENYEQFLDTSFLPILCTVIGLQAERLVQLILSQWNHLGWWLPLLSVNSNGTVVASIHPALQHLLHFQCESLFLQALPHADQVLEQTVESIALPLVYEENHDKLKCRFLSSTSPRALDG